MNYLFDILLLALVATCFFIGQKVGFIRTVLGLARLLFAFILAKLCGEFLAGVFYEQFARDWLVSRFTQAFSAGAQNAAQLWGKIPGVLRNLLDNVGVKADDLFADLPNGAPALAERAAEALRGVVTAIFAFLLVLILFFVFLFLLKLLIRLVDKVFDLPILRGLNTFLGGLFGALIGAFIVFLICYFWNNIMAMFPKETVALIQKYAQQSHLLTLFS